MSTQSEASSISDTLRFFYYIPSLPLAAVFTGIFGFFFIYLAARVYWTKSARFIYILSATALMETIGFILRIKCHYNTTLGLYVAMTLFLLLPPNALALVNYKAVGEIIRLSGVQEKWFFLKPKFVTWFFFSSDIFSFLLQGAGGGLQSSPSSMHIGIAVTLVGLGLQLFFFAAFGLITIYVHRSNKYQYHVEGQPNAKSRLILCLYVTIVLLYIRSIYRVAEFATGYGGPVARLEWAFYVFDSAAITLSFIFYSLFFIGNYLPKRTEQNKNFAVTSATSSTEKNDIETNSY